MNKPTAQTSGTKLLWRLLGITVPLICIGFYIHEPKAILPVLASVYFANLSGFMHGTLCGGN